MIIIYSSFSKDKILNSKEEVLSVKKGGPAFFIENVFKKNQFSYILKADKVVNIEIKLEKNKETGKVEEGIKTQEISFKNLSGPVLISTIGEEWIFKEIPKEKVKIFLDIQGVC